MEWKIISLVISRTYMAGLAAAPLSTREIAEAIGAEKSINSTHKALQRLQAVGLLVVVQEGAGRRPARWGLQQDETQIDWPILAEGNEDSAAVAFLSEEHNDDICVPLRGTQ